MIYLAEYTKAIIIPRMVISLYNMAHHSIVYPELGESKITMCSLYRCSKRFKDTSRAEIIGSQSKNAFVVGGCIRDNINLLDA